MHGLGTIINVAAIVLGGLVGCLFGKMLKERHQDALSKTCGVCTLFIGIAGAMEAMLRPENGSLVSGQGLLVVVCLALGALVGELLNIEALFEGFGCWLKRITGNNGDKTFVDAFVTATLTVSIGAMAIVGSIEDGLTGDYSILATKAVLDFIIILVMAGSIGKGAIFSAIPVGLVQGGMTALAVVIKPIMTAQALGNLSLIGNILIFCVGINLIWDKKIRVANLLPSLIFAVIAAFLPL